MKKESLLLAPLLKKLAREMSARVVIEPAWGVAGQITFKSGKRTYFRYNTLDLNPVGASDIAKDKDYAAFFMKQMGYPTPVSRAFFSDEWSEAIGSKQNARAAKEYARKIKYPVFVKPNSGSQGVDVFMARNEKELTHAVKKVFLHDRVALVQKPVVGKDYRIVVLDGTVISAYERIPLNVVGDGHSSIGQLLRKKQRLYDISNRDTRIRLKDLRMASKLRARQLRMSSVLSVGTRVYLLDNANLSSGGDSVDVTRTLHSSFKKIAVRLTKDMGLRFSGVDIMTADITKPAKKYCVLEINAAPGLDHYVKTGPAQQKLVEDMYRRVLKSLSR